MAVAQFELLFCFFYHGDIRRPLSSFFAPLQVPVEVPEPVAPVARPPTAVAGAGGTSMMPPPMMQPQMIQSQAMPPAAAPANPAPPPMYRVPPPPIQHAIPQQPAASGPPEGDKKRKVMRMAADKIWEDESLAEWPEGMIEISRHVEACKKVKNQRDGEGKKRDGERWREGERGKEWRSNLQQLVRHEFLWAMMHPLPRTLRDAISSSLQIVSLQQRLFPAILRVALPTCFTLTCHAAKLCR